MKWWEVPYTTATVFRAESWTGEVLKLTWLTWAGKVCMAYQFADLHDELAEKNCSRAGPVAKTHIRAAAGLIKYTAKYNYNYHTTINIKLHNNTAI